MNSARVESSNNKWALKSDAAEWEQGWSDHEFAQLKRMSEWPMSEKLRWLEESQDISLSLLESRRTMGLPTITPDGERV